MSPEIDTDYYNGIIDDPLAPQDLSSLHKHTFDKPVLKPSKFDQIKRRVLVKTTIIATFIHK